MRMSGGSHHTVQVRLTAKIFEITDWRLARGDEQALVYRPGAMTLLRRLAGTLAFGVGAGFLFKMAFDMGGVRFGSDPIYTTACVLAGLCAAVAVLLPLSCLWSHVTLRRSVRGLVVQKWGLLLPSSSEWAKGSLKSVRILAQEVMTGRHAQRRSIGYRWRVCLMGDAGEDVLEFWVHHEKDRPAGDRLPERVAAFAAGVHRLTGLAYGKPIVAAYGERHATGRHMVVESDPVTTRRTYQSLDDVPEEMRGRLEEMMEQARATGEPVVENVHVDRQTFHSLDEVPPELRGRVEEMMGRGGEGLHVSTSSSEAITFTGADGKPRTYHSVDEMPPDVRAVYEQMRKRM
ncbi:MAG: hypothetical protein GY851_08970 [bacterium]|nr:hypothetical protein [bacterium]